MKRIILYTALYKRPEITKICFEGIKRLQSYDRKRFEIIPLCVVSTDEDKALCADYGFNYCTAPNKPLGAKWNAGMKVALEKFTFDYLIQIGSDDLLDSHLLESYDKIMKAGIHHAGVRDLYFIEPSTRKALKYTYSTHFLRLIGAGRIFSRAALEDSHPLWMGQLNKGLDRSSEDKLVLNGYNWKEIKTSEPRVMDIKSAVNIWSMDRLMDNGTGEQIDFDSALSWVSDKERKMILELCTTPHEV